MDDQPQRSILQFPELLSRTQIHIPSCLQFDLTSFIRLNSVLRWVWHNRLIQSYTYISFRFSASRVSFQGYVNLIQADAIDFDSQQRIHVVAFLRHSIAFQSLNCIPHSTDFYDSIPSSALDNSFWNR
eukprot:jgi/Psemu1/48863/gm1.48863_g